MGTKFECDVVGCDGTAHKPGPGGGPLNLPTGWSSVFTTAPLSDVEKKRKRPRRSMTHLQKMLLVCPQHELPKFKLVAEDPDEEYGVMMDGSFD